MTQPPDGEIQMFTDLLRPYLVISAICLLIAAAPLVINTTLAAATAAIVTLKLSM